MKRKDKYSEKKDIIKKRVNADITDVEESHMDVDVNAKIEEKSAIFDEKPQVNDNDVPLTKREKQKLVKKSKKEKLKRDKEKQKISNRIAKKREKTSSKREVLTYEDMPLDESGSNRFQKAIHSAKTNKKFIKRAVIILVVLVVAVLFFANRDQITFTNLKNWVQYGIFNMRSDEQFPRSTDGDVINDGNFTRIGNNLVYVSDTKFVTMNNWGRTIYTTKQNYSRPVLVTAADSDLSIIYNLSSTEFAINTLDSTVYKGNAPGNLIVADISESGTYALVTQKDGYLCKLYVYSEDNEQIYAYSFADYYITSVSLDSSGDTAVVSGFSAHNGSQISAVYYLDFEEQQPVLFKEYNENAIYYVDHLTDRYCCIIGQNATYTLDTKNNEFTTIEYSGKILTAFTVNTDTNTFALSLSRSGDGYMCDILSFSSSGNLSSTITTELNISSISTYKNRIAVLSEDMLYLYNKDGDLISQYDAGLDPHTIVLYSKSDAYVLGVSEVRRLDL